MFESEKSVRALLQACSQDLLSPDGLSEYYFKMSSRRMRCKEVSRPISSASLCLQRHFHPFGSLRPCLLAEWMAPVRAAGRYFGSAVAAQRSPGWLTGALAVEALWQPRAWTGTRVCGALAVDQVQLHKFVELKN